MHHTRPRIKQNRFVRFKRNPHINLIHVFLFTTLNIIQQESIIANLESENEKSIRNHLVRVKKEDAPE